MDFTLKVREPSLCPRPETEELVELLFTDIEESGALENMRFLDVGMYNVSKYFNAFQIN